MNRVTIGEIKVNTLKLMFTNYSDRIYAFDGDGNDNIPNLEEDTEYAVYLVNMNECINRALNRLISVGALPTKSFVVTAEHTTTRNAIRVDLKQEVEDYSTIVRVIKDSDESYDANYPYRLEENGVIRLNALEEGEEYRIIYRPKEELLTELTPNTHTFTNVPDNIAILSPYFVKGELLEEDDSAASALARNLFEQLLADRVSEIDGPEQLEIKTVYGDLL